MACNISRGQDTILLLPERKPAIKVARPAEDWQVYSSGYIESDSFIYEGFISGYYKEKLYYTKFLSGDTLETRTYYTDSFKIVKSYNTSGKYGVWYKINLFTNRTIFNANYNHGMLNGDYYERDEQFLIVGQFKNDTPTGLWQLNKSGRAISQGELSNTWIKFDQLHSRDDINDYKIYRDGVQIDSTFNLKNPDRFYDLLSAKIDNYEIPAENIVIYFKSGTWVNFKYKPNGKIKQSSIVYDSFDLESMLILYYTIPW